MPPDRRTVLAMAFGAAFSGIVAGLLAVRESIVDDESGGRTAGSSRTRTPTPRPTQAPPESCPDGTVCLFVSLEDPDGNPVADELVRLQVEHGGIRYTDGRTDHEGNVYLQAPAGSDGCATLTVVFPTERLRLDLGCRRTGTVVRQGVVLSDERVYPGGETGSG